MSKPRDYTGPLPMLSRRAGPTHAGMTHRNLPLPSMREVKGWAREALRVHPSWSLADAVQAGYDAAFEALNPGHGMALFLPEMGDE